jgi:hypothetical protein
VRWYVIDLWEECGDVAFECDDTSDAREQVISFLETYTPCGDMDDVLIIRGEVKRFVPPSDKGKLV